MPRIARMPDVITQAVHLYLSNKHAEDEARRAKGDKRQGPYKILAEHCRAHGQKDDKGSYVWAFPSPVLIGEEKYTGVKLQARQPSPYFNEEAAQELISSLGPDAIQAATRTEIIWDYDMLFLFLQQGRIGPEDLDRVLVTPPKEYSLVALQGER